MIDKLVYLTLEPTASNNVHSLRTNMQSAENALCLYARVGNWPAKVLERCQLMLLSHSSFEPDSLS